ncbi:hypothetical protein, partial [Klebsiella quasipneumoniae]|uniref:hypothetical protein n=1 Tax=Klebsiella quasipneumoniae TaxID=1463165 RepID=UPI00272F60DF
MFDDYVSSENPEIVRLTVDLPLQMREVDSESMLGIQLNVREHAIFQRFSPLDVLTINDVSQEDDIDMTLATIFDMLSARA